MSDEAPCTIRTARARTSGENLFVVLLVIAPSSQELGPPTNPGRFRWRGYDTQPYMAVTRIVANLLAPDPKALAQFYSECFGLDFELDMGWITFLTKSSSQAVELHTASQGGSGTELPVISIGVDNIDEAEVSVRASGAEIVYWPINESWGLRRFYFRDPAGNLINVVDN